MRVLVLEDDPDLLRAVSRFLTHAGYAVDACTDLAGADERLAVNTYDVAVLDRGVPGGDGVDLIRGLREQGSSLPVLVLTARDGVGDRVEGLTAGADDYLVKPFAMAELVARVHALARRAPHPATAPILTLADLDLDPARGTARRGGQTLPLTAKEYAVLRYLLARAGTVVSRTDLVEHCWDENADPMSNVVDVRMSSLRRKLGPPPLVHTVRGTGWIADQAPPT